MSPGRHTWPQPLQQLSPKVHPGSPTSLHTTEGVQRDVRPLEVTITNEKFIPGVQIFDFYLQLNHEKVNKNIVA